MRSGDTIVALSSGAPPSGVAVIRLSGPATGELVRGLAGELPEPRRLALRALRDGGDVLDRGLLVWFPGPHSFTGEDCAELQVHGSPAVVRALLRALTVQASVRLAEAGEFTRRAFENGRLDLTEVEGLGDLIVAETEGQRRQAAARLDGALSAQIARWRNTLLDARAEIEARLDFADEGDVAAEVPAGILVSIRLLHEELAAATATFQHGRIVRDGLRIGLAGPPNVGKSSLLNALVKSDLAIVSDEPGTTRDIREVAMDLGGQLVIVIDMAGLREATGLAEAEGVRRAEREIRAADLILWLTAPDVPDLPASAERDAPMWRIATKIDLGPVGEADLAVSAATGAGIDELLQRLVAFASQAAAHGEPALISRERDRVALEEAVEALTIAQQRLDALELVGEGLRLASHALARLTGELDAEAVLDRLFLSFCIGK